MANNTFPTDRMLVNVNQPAAITLSGNLTLTMDTYNANYLAIDPGGSNRNVLLWPEADADGCVVTIVNKADAEENLVVKDDSGGTTVTTIGQDQVATIMCEGGAWTLLAIHDSIGTLSARRIFVSTEQTGTGSSQNVAHSLGATPSMVWWSLSAVSGGADTVAPGAHDATNCKFTVTSGVKFYAFAML